MTKQTKSRGFTIVELLIVIVVIAILAAITIVAYNGIQNRARASASQSAANTLAKKAEAANAVASAYPNTITTTGTVPANDFESQTDSSLKGSGITLGTPTATNAPSVVSYQKCSTPAGTNAAQIGYWNYANSSPTITYIKLGDSACTAYSGTLTSSAL